MNAHRDTGEHRQAYTFTGSYHWRQDTGGATPSPPRSYPYRRIPTQEDRTPTQATGSPLLARSPSRSMMIHRKGNEHSQEDRTPTQATGSPLLARSPSRSMMIHRKGNEHSQEHRDTDRLAPLQALTITDRRTGHRRDTDTGRQARPCWLALPLGL